MSPPPSRLRAAARCSAKEPWYEKQSSARPRASAPARDPVLPLVQERARLLPRPRRRQVARRSLPHLQLLRHVPCSSSTPSGSRSSRRTGTSLRARMPAGDATSNSAATISVAERSSPADSSCTTRCSRRTGPPPATAGRPPRRAPAGTPSRPAPAPPVRHAAAIRSRQNDASGSTTRRLSIRSAICDAPLHNAVPTAPPASSTTAPRPPPMAAAPRRCGRSTGAPLPPPRRAAPVHSPAIRSMRGGNAPRKQPVRRAPAAWAGLTDARTGPCCRRVRTALTVATGAAGPPRYVSGRWPSSRRSSDLDAPKHPSLLFLASARKQFRADVGVSGRRTMIDNLGDWDSSSWYLKGTDWRRALIGDRLYRWAGLISRKLELVKRSKGTRGMPGRGQARKDAASCDKPWGGARILRSMDFRMGQPGGWKDPSPLRRGQRGELKHLSTCRKRNQARFPK
jgi:hypothetical protein